MGVCPVCNCKTDELDFTAHNIGGKEYKICSFCHRQLKGFDNNSEPSEAQIKWLSAIVVKDNPERDSILKEELEKLNALHSQNKIVVEKAQPVTQKAPAAYGATAPEPSKKASSAPAQSDNEIIRQLQQRVEGLEAEIRMMKRKQMIKTIIELGAPIAMLLLLLIVFFASGLYDSIQQIIGMAGI
jgi:hypothetical protein